MTDTFRQGPRLIVHLQALTANYALLRKQAGSAECAAVVKANAYGLGVSRVAEALSAAGCKTFFVATLEEGIQLRTLLPQVAIGIFHGPYAGEERDYAVHKLTPVLNTPGQLERWALASENTQHASAILHLDSGMNRLGLSEKEVRDLAQNPMVLSRLKLSHVMSHLACGNDAAHPRNAEQLSRFNAMRALLPPLPASIANSSGIFLGREFHLQLARPGCALYGINPTGSANPMQHVATLSAPILQLRTLERRDDIGYGATHVLPRGARIATVQLGYADGYMRCLSNIGAAWIGGMRAPVIGRVSMDMTMLDVSAIPESWLAEGAPVEFIGPDQPVDAVADAAGTIGYEVFTGIGARVRREYL